MKVSEWLTENVDSHTIYSVDLLEEMPLVEYWGPPADDLVFETRHVRLGTRTIEQVETNEGQVATGNPKGAEPFDPSIDRQIRVFGGYNLAMKLDALLTETKDPGAGLMGRGFIHRACIAHIAAAGY